MPRISQLPSLTAADNTDEIAIVDVSASTTKKITRGDLLKAPLPTNSVTTAAIANGAVTAGKLDFPTLVSMKSVKTTAERSIAAGYANLGGNRELELTFNLAKPCVAMVTVSLAVYGGGDGEFRPMIYLNGTAVHTLNAPASTITSGRSVSRTLQAQVNLPAGQNIISAGVFLNPAQLIPSEGGYLSAIVIGNIT